MNEGIKNGLIVSGIAVIAYLLYKQFQNKPDVVVEKKQFSTPTPVEIELKPEPKTESVILNF
jgi:hypothetical protein